MLNALHLHKLYIHQLTSSTKILTKSGVGVQAPLKSKIEFIANSKPYIKDIILTWWLPPALLTQKLLTLPIYLPSTNTMYTLLKRFEILDIQSCKTPYTDTKLVNHPLPTTDHHLSPSLGVGAQLSISFFLIHHTKL